MPKEKIDTKNSKEEIAESQGGNVIDRAENDIKNSPVETAIETDNSKSTSKEVKSEAPKEEVLKDKKKDSKKDKKNAKKDDSKKKDENVAAKSEKKSALKKDIRLSNKVSPIDVALSIRHLSIMLKSGMAISEALLVLTEQTEDDLLTNAYVKIHADLQTGMSMAESMKQFPKIFSRVMISIVDVGEQGGTLEQNLIFLAEFLKKNHELNRKVKGALIYPAIVFGITVVEMLGVIFLILPQLETMFDGFDNIPIYTRVMMDSSKWIRENLLTVSAITVAFIIILWQFLKTDRGKKFKDKMAISFPIVKKLNKFHILTNFSRTLGILMEGGMPITKALAISSETVGNYYYAEVLQDVYTNVKAGNTVSSSLAQHPDYFTTTFTRMIQTGEETGALEDNLLYLHDFYTEEVEEMSANLTTLLEPLLLVFIALMIGVLAISVVGPMYQLTGSINGQ